MLQSFAACSNDKDFWQLAKEIYDFQILYNPIYSEYDNLTAGLKLEIGNISFLPISFFKTHEIKSGDWTEEGIFTSSGTTGSISSRHFIYDSLFYLNNAAHIFESYYGSIEKTCFLCLLPSYLEREGSSLIAMCQHFIDQSEDDRSAFYLYNHNDLYTILKILKKEKKKTVLLGVSYALLDFAESYKIFSWPDFFVIKTGGMKGKRPEMNSSELDEVLKTSFNTININAEYGMTECFSQLYSINGSTYSQSNFIKVVITDLSDPFVFTNKGKSGRINIIDLANINTCSFIATDDVGYINEHDQVVVQGRIDNSDLRGCNMLL
ncbi:MAG: acyl transferase [Saprospiraceae bacterium]